ncbi:MAG TPA: IS200/IS605 family transposase [Polyangiaceae bacterium]|nr:IS200/IS605 family transposase [Polyangiaceae bacterium]
MKRSSPTRLIVHLVWSTAHRRAVLLPALDLPLAELLRDKASGLGCSVLTVGVATDHVHVLACLAATACVADLAQRLKGASAHALNQRRLLPEALRWQVGYWAESVSPGGLSQLEPYVRGQRLRHDDAHPAEAWRHSVD